MKRSEIYQQIVETASRLFYSNGYNLTGINEIISEAGIAKATLYNHFRSKEDICIAYLKHKNSTFLTDIEAYVTAKPAGKEQIIAIFDFLNEFFQDRDFNGCWCIKTVAEIPKDNEVIRNVIQQQKLLFINLISQLITTSNSRLSDEDNQKLSRQIYLLYESAVSESYLHQEAWPIDSAKGLCQLVIA